jgi:large subunit ribosomal protein L29
MVKAGRYREKLTEELEDMVDELRTDLFNMRIQNTTKELHDVAKIRRTRRDLARVLTVLREKRAAGRLPADAAGKTSA